MPRALAVSMTIFRQRQMHRRKNRRYTAYCVAYIDLPILFEAACACSLASFAGSMVELTVDLRL